MIQRKQKRNDQSSANIISLANEATGDAQFLIFIKFYFRKLEIVDVQVADQKVGDDVDGVEKIQYNWVKSVLLTTLHNKKSLVIQ